MCGIFGYISKKGSLPAREVLVSATDRMLSRGPDHGGYWNDNEVFLGMRRLSIIDLNSGNQPMFSQNEGVVLVFNGEIYNYKKVKEDLIKLGHKFKTSSDTEVILIGYIQWGKDVVDRLNGMFAFAIYDHREKEVFIARDRLGEKPLFLYKDEEKIIFASETKAILTCERVDKTLNPSIINYYLAFGYSKPQTSIFSKIRKLNPGSFFSVKENELQEKRFWSLSNFDLLPESEEAIENTVEQLLEEAVEMRMVADVPVGAFLSGGIDSSLLVAMMRKHHDDVQTFTIGFNASKDYDETQDAKAVAKHLGVKNTCFDLGENELIRVLPDLAGYCDEPFADAAAFPLYCLSELTKTSAKVILSGDGGDELFAGYGRYQKATQYAKLAKISSFVPNAMSPLFDFASKASGKKHLAGVGKFDVYDFYQKSFELMTLTERRNLLMDSSIDDSLLSDDYRNHGAQYFENSGKDAINHLQVMDISTRLVESFLQKTDRAMMAQSIEGRLPFLDYRLVEYAMRIPGSHKLKGGESKYILKKILEKYIPSDMVYRPKHGFNVPLEEWIASNFTTYLEDVLFDSQCLDRQIFKKETIRKMIKETKQGSAKHARKLWLLLNFELWCRNNL